MPSTATETFFVTGHIGEGESKEPFESYCIASNKAAAIALMARTMPFFNPIGASSLEELRRLVTTLERVRTGELIAPRETEVR